MRIGILVTGDTSVRAAHSLQAHPGVDEVVVIGPAKSKSFEVVPTAAGCDYLVGAGSEAPGMASRHDVPLIWDGDHAHRGVSVWGASPAGITLTLAAREADPRLVALAHPDIPEGSSTRSTRFPDPVGRLGVRDEQLDDKPIAVAHSPNEFAACLAEGASRRVTVVDNAAFLSGVALAAGLACAESEGGPAWDSALPYLESAIEMGLVMAESA